MSKIRDLCALRLSVGISPISSNFRRAATRPFPVRLERIITGFEALPAIFFSASNSRSDRLPAPGPRI
jgi:hypothetical protein